MTPSDFDKTKQELLREWLPAEEDIPSKLVTFKEEVPYSEKDY